MEVFFFTLFFYPACSQMCLNLKRSSPAFSCGVWAHLKEEEEEVEAVVFFKALPLKAATKKIMFIKWAHVMLCHALKFVTQNLQRGAVMFVFTPDRCFTSCLQLQSLSAGREGGNYHAVWWNVQPFCLWNLKKTTFCSKARNDNEAVWLAHWLFEERNTEKASSIKTIIFICFNRC